MGCDIHDVAQVRLDGKWKTIEEDICNNRNYKLFAVLADVRNMDDVEPISYSRGLPDDFPVDQFEYHNGFWMGDHSHSYLTLAEIHKRYLNDMNDYGESELDTMDSILNGIRLRYENLSEDDVRIVFGFDSFKEQNITDEQMSFLGDLTLAFLAGIVVGIPIGYVLF